MTVDVLGKYLGLFGNLHRNVHKTRGAAPHKPILLLAVLDEIEKGSIGSNYICLTPELVSTFRAYWRTLVPPDVWQERIFLPFRYLVQDGFWTLVKAGIPQSKQQLGDPTSIGQLVAVADGAELSDDLWQLLRDRNSLEGLRTSLLKTYFGLTTAEVDSKIPANPVDYEIERLKAEAEGRFRAVRAREQSDDTGYYVRHALFPRVIKQLYDDTCAVCGTAVRTESGGGLVDAAHIMPFGLFHNDDPRNGIAICKNHHWGFDSGWFSISNEYRIVVSPRLKHSGDYVIADSPIRLPSNASCSPSASALEWHRENKLLMGIP